MPAVRRQFVVLYNSRVNKTKVYIAIVEHESVKTPEEARTFFLRPGNPMTKDVTVLSVHSMASLKGSAYDGITYLN